MPPINAAGVSLEVEEFGPPDGEAVLLIMGLAAQLVHWPDALVERLAASGRRVIRFDNRDVGLSQKFHEKRAISPAAAFALAPLLQISRLAPYRLEDMAKDAVGVLDALGIDAAHVVGASMGGMIGQVIAATAPARVKSFTAIMSSTNHPRLPRADAEVVRALFGPAPRPKSREEIIDKMEQSWRLIGTPESGEDPAVFRARLARAVDRCVYPVGVRRQLAAIIASGDLRRYARKIAAPTLVIHGELDRLAPPTGGRDIAAHVEGARFELIEGMGHDLPVKFLPHLAGLMLGHFDAAESRARAA